MKTNRDQREMLALGIFDGGTRLGDRVAMLLERGREFSTRVSRARMAASAAALVACIAAASIAPRMIALAQAPLRFEVASVRLVEHPDHAQLTCNAGREFQAYNNLSGLIFFAYQVADPKNQVVGGPTWMDSRDLYFDIEGKPAAQPVSSEDCRKMVQTLLAERFKLAVHKETREMPVYALVVSNKGSKLREAGPDEPNGFSTNILVNGHTLQVNDNFSRSTGRGMTMPQLAHFLQSESVVGRLVVDETGLTGVYPVTLDYATKPDDDKPDVFTALQDQLGLKLEPKKEPVEVLVIDHAEKPDEN